MACTAIDRRGAVLTRGVLITVHDLYGGPWLMKPMESYLHSYRNFQVQPFRFRPRQQVRRRMDTHVTAMTLAHTFSLYPGPGGIRQR